MTLPDLLRRDVQALAGDIGERNVWLPEKLGAAAGYIEAALRASGYTVGRQGYAAEGQQVYNLEAELPGTRHPGEVVIVGAHYDSRCGMKHWHAKERVPGRPGTPGADDNASGVAVVLALARAFAGRPPPRTVRFVAWVNEEPPFFKTPLMGSWVYAKRCRERQERLAGVLVAESLGYYSDGAGSQRFPLPLKLFYPTVGNFVALISDLHSRRLVRRAGAAFRRHSAVPSLTASVPIVGGVGAWSDDWAFWQEGYEAFAATDTAFFRNPHYHQVTDTPDTLDYAKAAAVTEGLQKVVEDLTAPPVDTPPGTP